MKSKLNFVFLAALAIAPVASADTELLITGSTAFRAAVHEALLNDFFSSAPKYAHDKGTGAVSGAGKSIWQGTTANLGSAIVTVRCSWSGSASGIQAVTDPTNHPVSFLTTSTLPASAGENPNQTSSESLAAKVAFSDVGQGSTVYITPSLEDYPVGVIPFSWVINDTSATGATVAARYGFDSITAQFARALYTKGSQKLSMLTANPSDTRLLYATGRDTGSGTRITMLVETKYGAFTPVKQFKITATGDAVTDLQQWPVGTTGGDDPIAGNGGYSSGGTLAGLLVNKTDTTFNLKNAAGTIQATPANGFLVSCVGISDSNTVVSGGGARLKYEGIGYDTSADDAKIQRGQYTMWGYEHMLNATLDADQTTCRDDIITAIDTALGSTGGGIQLSSMFVGREDDGGIVAP